MSRTFTAHSAAGEQLQFRTMTGYERMGHLFEPKNGSWYISTPKRIANRQKRA